MDPEYEPSLVSVIVPTYNREGLLIEALESVYRQSYRPIELLVIDDGSTDATLEVLHEWQARREEDCFRICVRHQDRSGAPAARNLGLIESQGEFIQYLDSDDWLHPAKIETLVESLRSHPNCSSAWAEYKTVRENPAKREEGIKHSEDAIYTTSAPLSAFSATWQALLRRELCVSVGPWREQLQMWQDVEYNLRLAARSTAQVVVPNTLHYMRLHSGERIDDLKFHPDEVHEAIDTLNLLENQRERLGLSTSNYRFQSRYFGVLRAAMQAGDSDKIRRAFEGLRSQSTDLIFRFKTILLQAVYHVMGEGTCIRILEELHPE